MKAFLSILTTFTLAAFAISAQETGLSHCPELPSGHRENGWYSIIDGSKDSIAPKPIVTVKEFVGLRLEKDPFGRSIISGQVSKHKLQAWADSTERLTGRRMGFVFNDSVVTASRINMRLESGAFQINRPDGGDMTALYNALMKEKKDSLNALFKANGWDIDSLFFMRLGKERQDSAINVLDYNDAVSIINGFGDR